MARPCKNCNPVHDPLQTHQQDQARSDLAWGASCCDLSDGKGVPHALSVALDALEPPLVANLDLQDVKVAIADRGSDELVSATLVAVSS